MNKPVNDLVVAVNMVVLAPAMKTSIDDMGVEDVAGVYSVLDALADRIEKRMKGLKAVLSSLTAEGEQITEKSREAVVNGLKVILTKKESAPDAAKVQALMKKKGLAVTEAFNEVKTLVMDPSKLEFLIGTGKLDKAEVDALRKPSESVTVKSDEEIKRLVLS